MHYAEMLLWKNSPLRIRAFLQTPTNVAEHGKCFFICKLSHDHMFSYFFTSL